MQLCFVTTLIHHGSATNNAPQDLNEASEETSKDPEDLSELNSGRPKVVASRNSATGATQHGQCSFAKQVGSALVFNFQKKKLLCKGVSEVF